MGVVLYEMVFGQCPFYSNTIASLIEVLNTTELMFPAKICNSVGGLLRKMLTKDPTKRIDWKDLLEWSFSEEELALADTEAPRSMMTKEAKADNPEQAEDPRKAYPANDHRKVVDGIKISFEILSSKMKGHFCLAWLVLEHAAKFLTTQVQVAPNADSKSILSNELAEIRKEQESLSRKVEEGDLPAEEDWKEYFKKSFVDDERFLPLWYRMVSYLDGKISIAVPSASMLTVVTKTLSLPV